jgi:hypothetical protein
MVTRLLAGLGILLLTAAVSADAPRHQAWANAALLSLPRYFEDTTAPDKPAQLATIAAAVAELAVPPAGIPRREWQALLLAVGFYESTYSLRVHRGECKLEKRECDAARAKDGTLFARAKSPWQLHQNTLNRDNWDQLTGIDNTDVQVTEANAALARGWHTCSRSGVPWQRAAVNGFAGRRCDASWPGLELRLAMQARLVRVVAKVEAGS